MTKEIKLASQPYKGARDFYPEEMRLQNYIFDTWKKVCKRFGFEEYNFPILEPLEIFAAKTGEEIVNQQLFSFEDKGGRKLAIRPELTPGTVRMIAQKYSELPQPIKWFMIGNNWRYEKPQMGRGREFYQLEANIFGVPSVTADFETISLIIALMQEFYATEAMYSIKVSDRRLISLLLTEVLGLSSELATNTRRLMDKRAKMEKSAFLEALGEIGLNIEQATKVEAFMASTFSELRNVIPQKLLDQNAGYWSIKKLFDLLLQAKLIKYVDFDPAIIRGFDYSDGLVYEVFDKNPENKRSLFGGERFDKLINIFGKFDLAATGFAMGDMTLKEFLEGWKLLPNLETTKTEYFITVWQDDPTMKFFNTAQDLATNLRGFGKNVTLWLEPNTKLDKQLKYADKMGCRFAIIVGEDELAKGTVTVKDLRNMTQETGAKEAFFKSIEK